MSSVVASLAARSPGAAVRAERTRVSIVDDSVVARGLFTRWLSEMPDVEMTGVHRDGLEALRHVPETQPDILILDIEMPGMDGLTALPLLLAASPHTRVLIVSNQSIRGADITLRCLMRGATDYLAKPSSQSEISTSAEFRSALVDKIRNLGTTRPSASAAATGFEREPAIAFARSAGRTHATVYPGQEVSRLIAPGRAPDVLSSPVRAATKPGLLAIGASTGGPLAVAKMLAAIGPAVKEIPIVLAQHMPSTYTMLFADHLRRHTGVDAVEISGGERLEKGRVHIARGGQHMAIRREGDAMFAVNAEAPPAARWAPSVDLLFEAVARCLGPAGLAVVLTGAGDDGALGAAAVAGAGGVVMAQDETSSANWGMPGAAARTGACGAVLSATDLGKAVARLIQGDRP
jgi:two-component system chemotaxis response regulator CheB